MGLTIDAVTFRNIDVVKAGRALNVDAYDTAVVTNTRYENIRIEAADSSMIALSEAEPPTWRTAANLTVQGKPVTSQTDADANWSINSFVSNITFDTGP